MLIAVSKCPTHHSVAQAPKEHAVPSLLPEFLPTADPLPNTTSSTQLTAPSLSVSELTGLSWTVSIATSIGRYVTCPCLKPARAFSLL